MIKIQWPQRYKDTKVQNHNFEFSTSCPIDEHFSPTTRPPKVLALQEPPLTVAIHEINQISPYKLGGKTEQVRRDVGLLKFVLYIILTSS